MREYRRAPDTRLLEAITGTLDGMARGGMRDQVGGGFHRYSVDQTWLVPHFEKMLYDNALLILAYSEAYQITKKAEYKDVVETTISYILRDMQSPEGGFYSAEDADSEKTEGKFYVWNLADLRKTLSPTEFNSLQHYFELEEYGNFHVDRRVEALEEAAGLKAVSHANILHHQKKAILPTLSDSNYKALIDKLFLIRAERVRPGLDDKILYAWNGLMIAALAKAYRVFGHRHHLEAAQKAANFLLSHLRDQDAYLLRSYRKGQARFRAYLEDYASLNFGLIELYQASFEVRWLKEACALQELQDKIFWEKEEGLYFETDGQDTTLIMRSKEMTDNATPCGNSLSVSNLLALHSMTARESWQTQAKSILQRAAQGMRRFPVMFPLMLRGLDLARSRRWEWVMSGPEQELPSWPDLCPEFTPHAVFMKYDVSLLEHCPPLKGRESPSKPKYFLCERGTCLAPCDSPELLVEELTKSR